MPATTTGKGYEPLPGDHVWWRGMRMVLTEVEEARSLIRYRNDYYRCVSNASDFHWDETYEFWVNDAVSGPLPSIIRGKVGPDPEPPRCLTCGKVTFRRDYCTGCRLEQAKAREEAAKKEVEE